MAGSGQHTIRVFDDGVLFAIATFTVVTLGAEYLTGLSGSTTLSFNGQTLTLGWSEPKQNLVITQASEGGGGGDTSLSSLIGRWEFLYTIVSTFADHYSLPSPIIQNGVPFILGTDLDFGGPVAAARLQDLVPGSAVPFTFGLLDPDITVCDFFIFNKTGTNTVSGQYYLVLKDALGNCASFFTGDAHPMTGLRFSTIPALASQMPADSTALDSQKTTEAVNAPILQGQTVEPAVLSEEAAEEALSPLNAALAAQR